MRILTKMRRQVAVYWPPGADNDYAEETYGSPVELLVRWVDVNQEILNAKGETALSNSEVYVGQDVELGGVLWLSSKKKGYTPGSALAELNADHSDPFKNVGAGEIQKISKTPTMKADDFLRVAYL